MQIKSSKRLVMVGIRRKGEKGFKTRIRKDMDIPLPDISGIKPKVTDTTANKDVTK